MIEIPCPWCGPRDAAEFRWTGEATPRPDPATASPEDWGAYLYLRRNVRGWVDDGWYHRAGCRRFFRLHRHSETGETWETGETR